MAFPGRIAIASKNAHKLRELGRICADWPVEWVTVETHEASAFPDVEETGATYLENAILKARAVAAALGLPAIADDSGIEVDALGGKPGPRSARFAGEEATDEQNLELLIRSLEGHPVRRTHGTLPVRGRARATPTAPTCTPRERARGRWKASGGGAAVSATTRSSCPRAGTRRWRSSPRDQKDRISHRGRAFRALRDLLG